MTSITKKLYIPIGNAGTALWVEKETLCIQMGVNDPIHIATSENDTAQYLHRFFTTHHPATTTADGHHIVSTAISASKYLIKSLFPDIFTRNNSIKSVKHNLGHQQKELSDHPEGASPSIETSSHKHTA